jgi:hypothetical protein
VLASILKEQAMMKVSTPLIQFKVLVDGKPVQEYHKDQSVFVEGKRGSKFDLQLTNLTSRRLLVHPTVDGLSVMTGEEAARNDSSRGYVLNGWEQATIPGWRLNAEEVARFFFAGKGKSYAEKTGRPENKGVIAAAVWEEKPAISWTLKRNIWMPVYDTYTYELDDGKELFTNSSITYTESTTADVKPESFSCCYGGEPTIGHLGEEKTQNLGTGFGKATAHSVNYVHFEVSQIDPNAIAVIYYDDAVGLSKRGIKVRKSPKQQALPNPFPKGSGCVPPPGWRG